LSGELGPKAGRPSPRATVCRVAMLTTDGISCFASPEKSSPASPARLPEMAGDPGWLLGWAIATSGASTFRRAGAKKAPAIAARPSTGMPTRISSERLEDVAGMRSELPANSPRRGWFRGNWGTMMAATARESSNHGGVRPERAIQPVFAVDWGAGAGRASRPMTWCILATSSRWSTGFDR